MRQLYEIFNLIKKKANLNFDKINFLNPNARGIPIPIYDSSDNCKNCKKCESSCPTGCINIKDQDTIKIDYGACIQCGLCVSECPESILVNSHLIHVYSFQRDNLVIEYKSGSFVPKLEETSGNTLEFQKLTRKRGFNYREVAAAGNNTVECELNASFNNVFDSEGNQVRNVASPKHADAILFSGPISKNMEGPLNSAWEVMPSPKALIACGTEAISGGLFEKGKSPSTPDIYIAGDPPRPDVIISAFRKLMGVFSYNFQETLIKTLNELKNSFNKKN